LAKRDNSTTMGLGGNMPWIVVVSGYFIGSIPTAYIAGRMLRGKDIRQMGDRNVGAANAAPGCGQ